MLLRPLRVPACRPTVVQGEGGNPAGLEVSSRRQHLEATDQVEQCRPFALLRVPLGDKGKVAVYDALNGLLPCLLLSRGLHAGVRTLIDRPGGLSWKCSHAVTFRRSRFI